MRTGHQQRGINAQIKIPLHIAHIAIIAFIEPGFQVPGLLIKPLGLCDTAIVKAQPCCKLFYECGMLCRKCYDLVFRGKNTLSQK